MSKIRLYGSTSGYVELAAPAVSDNGVLTLPTASDGFGPAGIGSNAATTLKTTSFSTTSTSYVDVTGLSVSITPTTATSKVLVIVQAALSASGSQEGRLQVVRDSTAIGNTSDGSSVRANFGNSLANREVANNNTLVLIDSPGTTSSTTYKVQVKTSANTLYVGRIAAAGFDYISSITAIEVAA